jgi:hypothetical protein
MSQAPTLLLQAGGQQVVSPLPIIVETIIEWSSALAALSPAKSRRSLRR